MTSLRIVRVPENFGDHILGGARVCGQTRCGWRRAWAQGRLDVIYISGASLSVSTSFFLSRVPNVCTVSHMLGTLNHAQIAGSSGIERLSCGYRLVCTCTVCLTARVSSFMPGIGGFCWFHGGAVSQRERRCCIFRNEHAEDRRGSGLTDMNYSRTESNQCPMPIIPFF